MLNREYPQEFWLFYEGYKWVVMGFKRSGMPFKQALKWLQFRQLHPFFFVLIIIALFPGLSQDLIFEVSWLFPDEICLFFCGPPAELRKAFENSTVSVCRRGVSITTTGKFLKCWGQNRKFQWLCCHFSWLFLSDFFFYWLFTDFPDFWHPWLQLFAFLFGISRLLHISQMGISQFFSCK